MAIIHLMKRMALGIFFIIGGIAECRAISLATEPISDYMQIAPASDYIMPISARSNNFVPVSLLEPISGLSELYAEDLVYVNAEAPREEILPEWATATPDRGAYDFERTTFGRERRGLNLQGLQFGLGVPVVMPMTGYNAWIGYMNKNSSSWLGRRIGFRADFLIPATMSAGGNLRDNGNGYDFDLQARLMGFNLNQSGVFSMDRISFDNAGQNQYLNLNGAEAMLALNNRFIGGLIDFYPFGDTWFLGGWRVSGGWYHGNMNLGASINIPNDALGGGYLHEVGNNHYINANIPYGGGRMSANVNWRYSGPYAGIGFDLGMFRGFKFFMDAGVVFAAPPRVRRQDIVMPELMACYSIGRSDCVGGGTLFSVNGQYPPSANGLMTNVVSQMITQNAMNNQAIYEAIRLEGSFNDANGNVDFGKVTAGVFGFLDGSSGSPAWIAAVSALGSEGAILGDALNNLHNNWGSGAWVSDFQNEIDSMWDDVDRGIYDLNNSLRDMRLMPVLKFGFMYRF